MLSILKTYSLLPSGHILCHLCANVSMLTAPPGALCTICGKKASAIKARDEFSLLPTPSFLWGLHIPEVWMSVNILGHFYRR